MGGDLDSRPRGANADACGWSRLTTGGVVGGNADGARYRVVWDQ